MKKLTEKDVFKIIAEVSGEHSPNEIQAKQTLDDLGFDSLDHIELVMSIEEEMQIDIPDSEAEELFGFGTTVQSILDYVASKGSP